MILYSRFSLFLFVLFFLLLPPACLAFASASETAHVTDAEPYGFNFHSLRFHRLATNKIYFEAKRRQAAAQSAQAATANAGEEAESGALEDAMAHLKVGAECQQSESADETPVDIHIFDAGCGDGSFARSLLNFYPEGGDFPIHYVGADVREDYRFIRDMKKRLKKKKASSGHTFSSAPKGDGNFFLYLNDPKHYDTLDVVSAMMVLHYVSPWNLPHALNLIHRALKDDGIFVGTVKQEKPSVRAHLKDGPESSLFPTYRNIIEGNGVTKDLFLHKVLSIGKRKDGLLVDAYTPKSLRALLETFGFDVQLCMSFEDTVDHPQKKGYTFKYVGFVAKKRQKPSADDAQTEEEQLDAAIIKARIEAYKAEAEYIRHKIFSLFEFGGWHLPSEWREFADLWKDKLARDLEAMRQKRQ